MKQHSLCGFDFGSLFHVNARHSIVDITSVWVHDGKHTKYTATPFTLMFVWVGELNNTTFA